LKLKIRYPASLNFSTSQLNPEVVVIGAGAAGLSATSELLRKKKSVLCIEAMNRIGGRCYTDNSIFGTPFDIGAHWMHSFSGNQIAKYGKNNKNKFSIYEILENILVYDGLKKVTSTNILRVIKKIRELKDKYSNKDIILSRSSQENNIKDVPFINLIPKEITDNEWFETAHQALGACLEGVDFNNYTTSDQQLNYKNIGNGDGFVKEGYGTLLADFRKDIPVKLNTIVREIKWDGQGVKVETNQGVINAKACIITVSTGVLNSGKIKFFPLLPKEKYEAFENIRLGIYNHITLQLKDYFYKDFQIHQDTYLLSKITSKSVSPKGYFGSLRLHKSNLSYFDVGGQFAKDLEKEGKEASIDFVLNSLRSTFGSNFDQYLIKAYATSWGENEFTMGSYSSAKPGKAHLREELKSSVGDRIYFAGEATSINYGTVHGADLSGKRVVEELIKTLK